MSENANVKPPVEIIPSVAGEISAIASAHAPFLYFEGVPAFGHINGIIRITLEASRDLPAPGRPDIAVADRVIVAHLRMNIPAAQALRAALDAALLIATPVASDSGDPAASPKPN
jgi:hypothetical protein